ncbi:PAS domain S-box protein [Leptolyngbya sp. CCNP1308]|uniref:PAS domain S-box protein n=1 Tax=Leptolyngbya sp. CCNP1308 TaxID=3110255 RepID=UPI002B203C51|nr:PAS domain S-box protein [Leptolyngbya sp. CCNP1308]
MKLSQQRYESLAQAAPVGIFQTDPEGNCTYVNDRWSAIAGLSFDSAQGQGWMAGLHPDDRAAVATEWYEAAQHKRPFSLEYRFQIATGAITWVYGQAVAERDDQGIITGYVGTVTDITDRHLAEEKLRENEARYRLLFQEANDIVLIHPLGTAAQPGQYFTDVNEITCRLLGYSRDELRQMTPLDLIPAEEMAEVVPEMEVLTETGQLLFEKTLVAKDGTHIPVELHAHVFDWQGEPTVLSIARNIQERKTAQAELEERERLFRSTFEQAAVGIAHVSPTGHFTRLNQRFCTILNYPHAELITLAFPDITHPDDLQVDASQVNRLLAGEDNTYSVEKRYIRKDGTIIWVNLTVALVRDHAGEPDYFIAVIKDISDRKADQERLRLALMAANQGIYDLNLKTDRVTVEPEYALMLGYEPNIFSETVSSWRERVHPEDRAAAAAAYQAYAQGETQQYRSEFRLRTQQGTWKWVLSIGKFVEWDAANQPVRLLGTHTDIDEHKRTEIALGNSEARFRQTFAHMGVGMCVCNLEGVFVRVNQRFCEITGYTAPEFVGMSFVDITHADDLADDLAQKGHLLQGQQNSYTLEKRYIRKDQTVIWVNLTMSLLRTADGEAQQFLGAIEDITARKLAEAELQTLNRSLEVRVAERTQALANANASLYVQAETLHQTNQLLTLVMDSIPQRIFWKDRNFVLLGCNRRFAQDLGLTIESAIGKRNLEFLATPDETTFYNSCDRQVMDSGEASLHTIETRRRSDGLVVHLDTSRVPLRNSEEQVIGLLGCYEDITQRRRLEANVQRQLQKEQVLSALVQQMRRTLDVQETFRLAVNQVRPLLGIDRVLVYVLNPDRSGRVIAESVAPRCPSLLGRSFPPTTISPECFQNYASGKVYSVADAKRGDLPSCIALFSKDIQVRAKVLMPIVEHGSDQVWGLLIGHQCDRPHSWQPWELEFLRQLSQHLAIAVRQIHLYDQLQQELHQRQQAEQALRASEARLQAVTDSVNACIAYLGSWIE